MKQYDYCVVGTGPFGATFAREATDAGKSVLLIEKRPHVAGHIRTDRVEGIDVHTYGAHIFHTSNRRVWDYVNRFAEFNRFTNSPVANYKGEIYNLPFNMNTFNRMWGVVTPEQARTRIEEQRGEIIGEPGNLEEQAISLVGRDIYTKLIKGYTEKQWGRECKDLPAFIIKRLPVRFVYDNNYFDDPWQGIPVNGYTAMIEAMIEGIDLRLNFDFFEHREAVEAVARTVVYTGPIDQFFDYRFGQLDYRTLRFETRILDQENYQGNAVVNYTDAEIPYTRILEHKHFNFGKQDKTVVTWEYPAEWKPGDEPYYPVNDERNQTLYQKYLDVAREQDRILFGGRLAEYKYYNMDQVIASCLEITDAELNRN